jgi:hypothetical protein
VSKIRTYALRHFETTLIVVIILGVVLIALLVQYKFAFLNFFFLPVILAGYYLGKRQAVLTASLCILLFTLYNVFFRAVVQRLPPLSLDDVLSTVTWAGFLILTAAFIGAIADEREAKLKNMRRAYVGMLEIMLRYLEVADDKKPRSVRLALLAGRIAATLGLPTYEAENIKSAALLLEVGDLRSNISLYGNLTAFMATGGRPLEDALTDRDQVLLQTTALLLKDIGPILANYFYHYVEEADILDKDLSTIPIASSVVALAELYDRIHTGLPLGQWAAHVKSVHDIHNLSGRAFPALSVRALFQVVSLPG